MEQAAGRSCYHHSANTAPAHRCGMGLLCCLIFPELSALQKLLIGPKQDWVDSKQDKNSKMYTQNTGIFFKESEREGGEEKQVRERKNVSLLYDQNLIWLDVNKYAWVTGNWSVFKAANHSKLQDFNDVDGNVWQPQISTDCGVPVCCWTSA